MSVILTKCTGGERLISVHGEVLYYLGPNPRIEYPHRVQYADGTFGSRTDDGQVFRKKKLPEDHDIASIDGAAQFVILEGLKEGNRFFSTFVHGEDPTLSAKGEKWYMVIGYADTVEQAQKILYGTNTNTVKIIRSRS